MIMSEASKTIFICAIMDASGHTEADATLILSELNKSGWHLVKFIPSAPLTQIVFSSALDDESNG